MRTNTSKKMFTAVRTSAFTLIELLVVIAVIGILAGMILGGMYGINKKKTSSVALAEMTQVIAAIEAYKVKYGFYPPDNPTNVYFNPLYFELVGTVAIVTNNSLRYYTLDGSYSISTNDLQALLGVQGIANSATSARGDDERPAPANFLKELKPGQIATNSASGRNARVLACSIGWDGPNSVLSSLCQWRYNSSHPTNNSGTFDLWVDLLVGDKTNRYSNWSKIPQTVWTP